MEIFTYRKAAQPGGQPEFVAALDLDGIVAIRAPRGADVALVQTDSGGFHMPHDDEAARALMAAFAARHAGLVASYICNNPDADPEDAPSLHAMVRLDKIRAIHRLHNDPSFVLIRTSASRAMVLPYHATSVDAITEAWAGLSAVAA